MYHPLEMSPLVPRRIFRAIVNYDYETRGYDEIAAYRYILSKNCEISCYMILCRIDSSVIIQTALFTHTKKFKMKYLFKLYLKKSLAKF